jgi:hypothetical protein
MLARVAKSTFEQHSFGPPVSQSQPCAPIPPSITFTMSQYDNCTDISPACPVEETIYGYYPSLGANGWGAGFFGLCLFVNIFLGWRYKLWTYMIAMCLACLTSTLGYIGRILMNDNPWDEPSFLLQIITLTFSPAFNSAAIVSQHSLPPSTSHPSGGVANESTCSTSRSSTSSSSSPPPSPASHPASTPGAL